MIGAFVKYVVKQFHVQNEFHFAYHPLGDDHHQRQSTAHTTISVATENNLQMDCGFPRQESEMELCELVGRGAKGRSRRRSSTSTSIQHRKTIRGYGF